MKRHLDDELKRLKDKLFRMGLQAEEAIVKASKALFERDSKLAEAVIKGDQEINLAEIEIDELGHELIALHQPTAVDLRFITMVLKINSDLERMGDQAVNIAEKAIKINQEPPAKPYIDLPKIAETARGMVRDALDAFMKQDAAKAKEILEKDDVIDEINDRVYEDVQKLMREKPDTIPQGVALIMVSHNLERLADLATNIAEDVIYLTRGIDVRHHIRERREEASA
ncbi:MAG: phosphate signaling complex protein PhoU [Candidatus Omnitrophica bacterium]|nr:phosphate signaling complex protein PhoU [Candidatus Omnitrophota bacterium]